MKKRKDNDPLAVPKGSIAEAYEHGRGIVGYLHVSPNAETDFHACQKKCDLEETKIDQDCKTRWRSAHAMGEQLVHNKLAILEMDKNPMYKDPGQACMGKEQAFCGHVGLFSSRERRSSIVLRLLLSFSRETSTPQHRLWCP